MRAAVGEGGSWLVVAAQSGDADHGLRVSGLEWFAKPHASAYKGTNASVHREGLSTSGLGIRYAPVGMDDSYYAVWRGTVSPRPCTNMRTNDF